MGDVQLNNHFFRTRSLELQYYKLQFYKTKKPARHSSLAFKNIVRLIVTQWYPIGAHERVTKIWYTNKMFK